APHVQGGIRVAILRHRLDGATPPEASSGQVERRAGHPAADPLLVLEAFPPLQRSSERLLGRVLRHRPVATQQVDGMEDRTGLPLVDVPKSRVAAHRATTSPPDHYTR